MDDFDHHAFTDHRARIVGKVTQDEAADSVDFLFRNRRRLTLERDDADDTRALQNWQTLLRIESREAVSRKQRPIDLLLAIFPAAPAGDGRKEGFNVLLLELFPNNLFVSGPRPQRKPVLLGVPCRRGLR